MYLKDFLLRGSWLRIVCKPKLKGINAKVSMTSSMFDGDFRAAGRSQGDPESWWDRQKALGFVTVRRKVAGRDSAHPAEVISVLFSIVADGQWRALRNHLAIADPAEHELPLW